MFHLTRGVRSGELLLPHHPISISAYRQRRTTPLLAAAPASEGLRGSCGSMFQTAIGTVVCLPQDAMERLFKLDIPAPSTTCRPPLSVRAPLDPPYALSCDLIHTIATLLSYTNLSVPVLSCVQCKHKHATCSSLPTTPCQPCALCSPLWPSWPRPPPLLPVRTRSSHTPAPFPRLAAAGRLALARRLTLFCRRSRPTEQPFAKSSCADAVTTDSTALQPSLSSNGAWSCFSFSVAKGQRQNYYMDVTAEMSKAVLQVRCRR